ncbi:uncharacterized protein OCT59_024676 [Rhizophagus irregularis]|uniref:Type VII secretion system protein EssD-like domain-containing protein n=3 Tax=Rhizophagus irregularis TaxID=588596 RepID=A0A915ZAD0_9GLOM|nr:hypothetical protein RirG_146910 [Rhizophagus irregularis DAOM 197198w]UZO04285.1 hypothetical protein OCT59_024676 [Rhizophagus irregularis]CAB5369208.1 unnamed protein product [Rhizophagus irregularis]CAG8656524.1 3444_t:CDS:1 [Rhizophagus irregularis]
MILAFIPLVKSREFTCSCCGKPNNHYEPKCPFKGNCPLKKDKKKVKKVKPTTSSSRSRDCKGTIEGKIFLKKGEKFKQSCKCAKKGDERCHLIADMLGGSRDCDNCMSCSHKMNTDMKRMEKFVKNSDGGVYIVTCDNYEYAKIITQIFSPYKGNPTTTVIYRESPRVEL